MESYTTSGTNAPFPSPYREARMGGVEAIMITEKSERLIDGFSVVVLIIVAALVAFVWLVL